MSGTSKGRLFRVLVSGALLLYVAARVDWTQISELLKQARLVYVGASIAIGAVLVLISVWKWALLLRARQRALSVSKLYRLYLVGYFFNNLLPSNVGGDLVRAYEAGLAVDDHATAMASVFVERFTGLGALVLLACWAFLLNLQLLLDLRVAAALGTAMLGSVALLVMVLTDVPIRRLPERYRRYLMGPLAKVEKLQRAIRSYSEHRTVLLYAIGISFLFYLCAVLNVWIAAMAFGENVSISALLVIVPVVLVISMIPISLGGIGLQEWAYVFSFTAMGVGGSLGLLVALLMRIKGITFGILGGLLYARSRETAAKARELPGRGELARR